MGPTLSIDVGGLEQFLKKNQSGPDVVTALRYRTMVHWLRPELDRLSARMIPAYEKLCELVEWPFNLLDAGCMTGYLKHFMRQRVKDFRYVGIDSWPEALTVAREFDPGIEVYQGNLLTDNFGEFDYVWCSNINFGEKAADAVRNLAPMAQRACFFAMPQWCGDYVTPAQEFGEVEVFDCGETQLIRINVDYNLRRIANSSL